MDNNVIIFDNLSQSCGEIAGQYQAVKAIWPVSEHFSQPNAKGELYKPKNLEDICARAIDAGESFKAMFQSATSIA